MVSAANAAHFWAAVEDCLVKFHRVDRARAAELVIGLWRRLPARPEPGCVGPTFEDMIYHAEPWDIACNLVGHQEPLEPHDADYRRILRANGLA